MVVVVVVVVTTDLKTLLSIAGTGKSLKVRGRKKQTPFNSPTRPTKGQMTTILRGSFFLYGTLFPFIHSFKKKNLRLERQV